MNQSHITSVSKYNIEIKLYNKKYLKLIFLVIKFFHINWYEQIKKNI